MTLGEFFDLVGNNPNMILFYFLALPLTAFLAGILGKEEGHLSPWKYLYSSIIFLVCVPGIFAITLNIYLFLFERKSVLDANLYIQVLPIILMLITLWVISRNVKFEQIPGFNKITGLAMVIVAVLIIMWIMEKTHIIAITFMPFYYVFIIFIVLFFVIRFGMKKMWTSPNQ